MSAETLPFDTLAEESDRIFCARGIPFQPLVTFCLFLGSAGILGGLVQGIFSSDQDQPRTGMDAGMISGEAAQVSPDLAGQLHHGIPGTDEEQVIAAGINGIQALAVFIGMVLLFRQMADPTIKE